MNRTPTDLCRDGALDVRAAVEFSGISRSQLYEEMAAGRLAYIKRGRRRLVPKVALQELLASRVVTSEQSQPA